MVRKSDPLSCEALFDSSVSPESRAIRARNALFFDPRSEAKVERVFTALLSMVPEPIAFDLTAIRAYGGTTTIAWQPAESHRVTNPRFLNGQRTKSRVLNINEMLDFMAYSSGRVNAHEDFEKVFRSQTRYMAVLGISQVSSAFENRAEAEAYAKSVGLPVDDWSGIYDSFNLARCVDKDWGLPRDVTYEYDALELIYLIARGLVN